MSGNSILNNAKYSSDTDEWYTPIELIEEEISHYSEQFAGKVVLCNCDDRSSRIFHASFCTTSTS